MGGRLEMEVEVEVEDEEREEGGVMGAGDTG